MSRSLKAAALAVSTVLMFPVIQGFWLGYLRTVSVEMKSSFHLLMKPLTEMVYSSMPFYESWNIFQSVPAKQSCSVASATSDNFRIVLVLPSSVLLVSRNQEDIIMVRFAKGRAGRALYASLCVATFSKCQFVKILPRYSYCKRCYLLFYLS